MAQIPCSRGVELYSDFFIASADENRCAGEL